MSGGAAAWNAGRVGYRTETTMVCERSEVI
jgi:hypothetical protein